MLMIERRIPSSDGIHKLYCRVYTPDGEPQGLFHVAHGMTEHISRYDGFMRKMAEEGFICYGYDHLGHGYTANDESDLGYLGSWELLVEDLQNVSRLIKSEHPSLPCYLLGHSMGSFIARCAATPRIWKKVVLLGTSGPTPAAAAGLAVVRAKIKKDGERAISPEIEKMVFVSYRSHFKDEDDVIAWVSSDKKVRDTFRQDKFCTFHFTLNGFYTLLKLHTLCNSKTWFKNVGSTLPILLLSGIDDPVGNYGKGVTKVYKNLKANGKNVKMKLYDGCRHEILNDFRQDEVTADILDFIRG